MTLDEAPEEVLAASPGDGLPLDGMEAVMAVLASAEPRVYLLHHLADPDALGAAHALSRRWPGTLVAQGGLSAAAKRLAARLGAEVSPSFPPEVGIGVAVDTGSANALGPLPDGLPLVVVDHHAWAGDEAWPGLVARLVEPHATSTCEVVLPLLWAQGEGIAEDEAFAMLCGLVADTRRFKLATKDTLTAAFVLMDQGASLQEAIALLEQPRAEERSERIARLRAAQRAEVHDVDGLVVASSHIRSFESQAADGLIALGADVALVGAQRGEQASVSIRIRRGLERRVTASTVVREASTKLGGGWDGGGHPGAAGMNGPGAPEPALAACLEAVRSMAGAQGGRSR